MTKEEFITTYVIKIEKNLDSILTFYKNLNVLPHVGYDFSYRTYIGVNSANQLRSYYHLDSFCINSPKIIALAEAEKLMFPTTYQLDERLKGSISNFPIEVVEKMLYYQKRLGFPEDVTVFQKDKTAGEPQKGFYWEDTSEGYDFWKEVIFKNNFTRFFEKYPKQQLNFGEPGIISKNKNTIKLNKTFKYKRR